MEISKNACPVCHKVFKTRGNIYKHVRKIHGLNPEIQGKILCPDDVCKCSFTNHCSLREHLSSVHELVIQKEERTFDSKTDFVHWKECTEKETNSIYRKKFEGQLAEGVNKAYYYCHRSGHKTSRTAPAFNVKTRKKRNSIKMGSHCPSSMEVSEKDDKVHLVYYSTHFGHQKELKYLMISKSERSELAKKLSEGMSMDMCLEEVHNSLTGELKRIHLLTKRDLRNIRARNCPQLGKHSNDATSITKWVKEDKASQRNLSIFYKSLGSLSLPLKEEDMVLVIMSPPQKEMYTKFCGALICIESTHVTTASDLQLTTIVVADEFGAGFPAAFCLSNRVEQRIMAIFFDAVSKATTTTTPVVFMSDDVPAFYDAWKEVNGDAKRQVICPWHVKRHWRKALSKICSKEKKVSVYKRACILLEEADASKFEGLLKDFLQELTADNETKNFGIHFEKVYANRPKAWSLSYRLDCEVNTDMYLEAMHEVVDKDQQLDTCLDHLLKVVRDQIYSRLTHLVNSGESFTINIIHDIIHERHEKSLELSSTIKMMNSTTWKIRSADQASPKIYTVSRVVEDCNSCPLKCFYCEACVHNYKCTCIDYNVELNMCEHIHFLLSKYPHKSKDLILKKTRVKTKNQQRFKKRRTKKIISETPKSTTMESTAKKTSAELKKQQKTKKKRTKKATSETPKSTTSDLQHKFDLALSLIRDKKCDTETSQKIYKIMDNAINLISTVGKRKIDGQDESEDEQPDKKKLPRFFFKKMCPSLKPLSKDTTS